MTDLAALRTDSRPFFDVGRGCLCCEVLHPAFGDGIADLRLKLEAEREHVLLLMYTVELLLGRPLALLHQAWLADERAIDDEVMRRMDGPRD